MTSFFKYIVLASLPLALNVVPFSEASAQRSGVSSSQSLQDALRRIARNSNDSSALADAGLAALELGDTRAAIGFLAKADQIYPRSGRVKAGLAKALLLEENPFGAIRYFDQAVKNGIAVRNIAADRGLAYDLIGRNADAQKDYVLAMRSNDSDELRSRYAVSLGISGDLEKADAALNPLLQKSDRDAWRNRAFLLAMNGRGKDANAIARKTMQRNMAKAIKPFFDRMPKLTAAQKAAAIHLGHFPASENIGVDVASVQYASNTAVRGGDGADAGLIPLGEPLGAEVKKPRVLAMPDTSARRRPGARRGEEVRRVSQRELRRMKRQGIKYKVVSAAELPKPGSARPLSEPRVAKPKQQIAQTAAPKPAPVSKPSPPKTKPASTAPKPNKRAVASNSKSVAQSPGFETALGAGTQSGVAATNKKPVKLASVELPTRKVSKNSPPTIVQPKPKAQPPQVETQIASASPKAKAPTPLISETVVRKVDLGGANPSPVSTSTQSVANKPPVTAKPEAKPTQLASFNLNTVPSTSRSVNTSPVRMAQAEPAKRPLADIIGAISIPDSERKTDVVPVDLRKITPAKRQAKAKPEPEVEPKKVEPEKEAHPKRYWVQIATGSNLNALRYDFRQMKKKNAKLFGDMEGWTSPWGNTRRMAIGPFDDLSSAKKFDAALRKSGGDSFAWVSSKGTEVNKLAK